MNYKLTVKLISAVMSILDGEQNITESIQIGFSELKQMNFLGNKNLWSMINN